MKGSDLLVAALENEGVEQIFGVPGEENLDVVESLRRSRIKLIVTRHEQAAAFMAATHGRLTGKPGVCLATLGPGALNLTTGAAFALLGAMPMVMITGQKGILSHKQALFQVVDIVSTMAPLTKMARQIVSAATIPSIVREAFRLAQQERLGPVHLELPEDIAHEMAPDVPLVMPHPIEMPVAQDAALDRAADLILRAERPLVMLGAAASRPKLADALSQFVRRLRIPFFNTQMGKGAVAGGSNLYMGTAALSERDYVHQAIDRADLIIAIGHDTVEKPPFIMGPKGPKVLHVSYLPATVEEVYSHMPKDARDDENPNCSACARGRYVARVGGPDPGRTGGGSQRRSGGGGVHGLCRNGKDYRTGCSRRHRAELLELLRARDD
jgi:acetolactate synthase I/II/III large subunit